MIFEYSDVRSSTRILGYSLPSLIFIEMPEVFQTPGSVFTNISSLRIKNVLRNRAFSLVVEDVIVTLSNENALFLRIFLILRLEMLVNTDSELGF